MEKSQRNKNIYIHTYIQFEDLLNGASKNDPFMSSWTQNGRAEKLPRKSKLILPRLLNLSQSFSNSINLHPLHDFHHQLNGGNLGDRFHLRNQQVLGMMGKNAVINWGYTWIDHVLIAVHREDHRPKLQKQGIFSWVWHIPLSISKKTPRFLQLKSLVLAYSI